MMPKKQMTSRFQQIFFGQCYTCHKFGHMARECKQRKGWKRMETMKQKGQGFLKYEGSFYGYCYFYHKFGHKADNCRIKEEDEWMIRK